MGKIDNETANIDFDRFILALGVNDRKLDKLSDEKEEVIRLIEYGNISIDPDGKAKYKLDDPIVADDKTIMLDSVSFGTRRITVGEMEKKMTGKNDMEKTRNMFGYLTSTASGYISKMQGDDFLALSQIAAFFLPR